MAPSHLRPSASYMLAPHAFPWMSDQEAAAMPSLPRLTVHVPEHAVSHSLLKASCHTTCSHQHVYRYGGWSGELPRIKARATGQTRKSIARVTLPSGSLNCIAGNDQ